VDREVPKGPDDVGGEGLPAGKGWTGEAQIPGTATRWLWATVAATLISFLLSVLMVPSSASGPSVPLALLLFIGSSVHVASTGWLYSLADVRRFAAENPLRYLYIPVGLVGTTALTAASLSPATFVWFLLPYFAWQFFHYQKQNLGITALTATSHHVAPLRPIERCSIVVAGLAGIGGLMARPQLLQLTVHADIGVLSLVAELGFAIAGVVGITALIRRPKADRPRGFCVVFVSALFFSLPVFLFSSPYAAVGGMTLAHGFQYLLLIGAVAHGTGRGRARILPLAVLFNVALLGGVVLSSASHLHNAGPVGRLVFGAYLGVVMAHFVIDAGFWRLRNPFPRAFLKQKVPYLMGTARVTPTADRSSADIV
jgi:hypothetical protein